jgi:FkbM family methyltransferase
LTWLLNKGFPMSRVTREIKIGRGKSFRIVLDSRHTDPFAHGLMQGVFWIRDEWNLISRFLPPSGGRFLDLGGHLGSFALTAAAHGHEVLTIEASPVNAALLQASAEVNGFSRMTVVNAAIYHSATTVRFFECGPFGYLAENGPAHLTAVPALPMNEILARHGWDRVDCIKMDIEGSEMWAVEGMREMLARPDGPVIFYESNGSTLHDNAGSGCHELRAKFESLDYCSFEYRDWRTPLQPVNATEPQPDHCPNCLAIKSAVASREIKAAWGRRLGNAWRACLGRRPIAASLRGWPVGFPASEADLIKSFRESIAAATGRGEHNFCEHLHRELALASAAVRSDRVIQRFLAQPLPAVSQAA